MTFTLTSAWWWIPTAITVFGLIWVFWWPADRDGLWGGITTMLLQALLVIALSWAIAGALK